MTCSYLRVSSCGDGQRVEVHDDVEYHVHFAHYRTVGVLPSVERTTSLEHGFMVPVDREKSVVCPRYCKHTPVSLAFA